MDRDAAVNDANPSSDAPVQSASDEALAPHLGRDAPPEHPPGATQLADDEDEHAARHGDDGTAASQRPSKRRRVEELTPRRSISRAASPPWRSFAADIPTTIITDNGIRKSGRVNREAPAPEPVKRGTRHTAAVVKSGGGNKKGAKSSARAVPAVTKKPSTPAVSSPAQRKSERQRRPPGAAAPTSPAFQNGSPESTKRRVGRPRRSTLASNDDPSSDVYNTPMGHTYNTHGYDQAVDQPTSPTSTDPNATTPRLRLRLRKPDPPNRHPQHVAPPPKFPSFADWLKHDDPLEGDEGQRITQERADEEAERRIQIVNAVERGVLSQTRCSIFIPEAAEEPPPQYRHWDHVVAHAINFNKLLKEEKTYHRRIAKTLAREAVDYWKEKYKRKTQEEIDQEESDRAILRYKQLVKDVKDAWALVKVDIDKERVAKWEEEQRQLGHKAMDDMFNQAQEILGRNVVDSASSLVSEDRDFEVEDDASNVEGSNAEIEQEDDENMSSDGDSEEGQDNDEDANLTAEQLRAKYGELPDLPADSSEIEGDEEEDEEGNGSGDSEDEDEEAPNVSGDERTPEPTPDPDIEMEDASELPANPFLDTNGFHDGDAEGNKPAYIDPATVELEQVDDALLDSDDDGANASGSGSEEWPSDEESGTEEEEDEEQSESGSEDGGAGVLGFLAPDEIKKMKEAAKAAIEGSHAKAESVPVNGVNGHENGKALNGTESPHPNGDSKDGTSEAKSDIEHVKIVELASAEAQDPSMEVEPASSIVPKQSLSRDRSHRSSSPPRTEIPSLLRGTLREYQHDGLDWLANLYESDTNGILADEMGLGKTIQTIALLAYLAVKQEAWGPHLVVVPTSVMLNWEMEFKKWCPGFKILTYYGDISERKAKRKGWRTTGPEMFNVVITSYQLILQDASAFKMRAWQYLILDEAHNIKNFKSLRWQTMLNLRTERRLLLTGTPLQNNIDELWSLLYFLMPAGFAGEGRIAGLEDFTMALKNPTSQILDQGRQQLDAEAQKIVRKLHEVLRPYLLRRLKADVEKQMPGKYEHVVYCKLSKRQRQLYDGFMGRADTKAILSSGNYMSIIHCLMSLRKVCNHPDLFEERAIVTSMAMPKSVVAAFEIKDLLIRRRLQENEDTRVSLEALNLSFAQREQSSKMHARRSQQIRATHRLSHLIERQTRSLNSNPQPPDSSLQSVLSAMADREAVAVRDHLQTCLTLTQSRTQFLPIYGKDLVNCVTWDYQDHVFGAVEKRLARGVSDPADMLKAGETEHVDFYDPAMFDAKIRKPKLRKGVVGFRAPRNPLRAAEWYKYRVGIFDDMVPTLEQRAEALEPIVTRFSCVTPAVAAEEIAPLTLSKKGVELVRASPLSQTRDPFHEARMRLSIAFPDKRLLQYDCGKLQRLATLLRDLQPGGHRALIFTQMTKVLDVLERFLNIHGYRYLRLDGATKVEQRQILTERFNSDNKIPVFILSSRSGGLGINLTGADTVIFYDLDWNPAMDKQCQDRSHRIGQTRDVHIYKFVSEYTIEANILRKSNQKRLLDDVIIQKGDFTTDYFQKVSWRDALDTEPSDEAGAAMDRVLGDGATLLGDASLMRNVEDTEDQSAALVAQREIVEEIQDDEGDFNETTAATTPGEDGRVARAESEVARDRMDREGGERRHVDEYMLSVGREEWGKEPYKPLTDRQKRGRKGDAHRSGRRRR